MFFHHHPLTWKGLSLPAALVFGMLFPCSIQAQRHVVGNTRPTLDRISNYSTRFSTDLHFIELSGITAGDETDQTVTIEASTGDRDLIESISADLVDNSKAFIRYRLKEGAAGTATVKVVVTDNGETPASITRTFRITAEPLNRDLPAKSLQQATNDHLKAFPNPAFKTTRVYFSTPHDQQRVALDLYTLSGAKIRQLFAGSMLARESYYVDVNSRNLAAGIYMIRLTGESHTANLKLVVAR